MAGQGAGGRLGVPGDYTPEALGDYCSGTNHVLPTAGAARAYSGVSVASFQNLISVQSASAAGLAAIGGCARIIASAEGWMHMNVRSQCAWRWQHEHGDR